MKLYKSLENPALLRALSHPLRAKILAVYQEQEASPKELAAHFGVPLANVAYHTQVLRKLRLIRLVRTSRRRGAVEHYYKADQPAHIYDEAWSQTPGVIKERMVAAVLEEVAGMATEAAVTGGFDHRDAHLSRSRVVLDDEAWNVVATKLVELVELVEELEVESAERLRTADHAGERRAGLVMMLFESAPSVPEPEAARQAAPAGPPAVEATGTPAARR